MAGEKMVAKPQNNRGTYMTGIIGNAELEPRGWS